MPRGHRRGQRAQKETFATALGMPDPGGGDRTQRTVIFSKTKMCKFHILGICAKGTGCKFAHHKEELNPLPDLSRTKLCKTLISTGSCEEPDCKYAHNREQLRAMPEADRILGESFLQGLEDQQRARRERGEHQPQQPQQQQHQQQQQQLQQQQQQQQPQQRQQQQQMQQQMQQPMQHHFQQPGQMPTQQMLQAYLTSLPTLPSLPVVQQPLGSQSHSDQAANFQQLQQLQAQQVQLQMLLQQQYWQSQGQQLGQQQQQQQQEEQEQQQAQQVQQQPQHVLQTPLAPKQQVQLAAMQQVQQQQKQLLARREAAERALSQAEQEPEPHLTVKNTFYDFEDSDAPKMSQVPRSSTWACSLAQFARTASAESMASLGGESPGGYEQHITVAPDTAPMSLVSCLGGPIEPPRGTSSSPLNTLPTSIKRHQDTPPAVTLGLRRGGNKNASGNNLCTLDEAGEHDAAHHATLWDHRGSPVHVKNTFIEVSDDDKSPMVGGLRLVHTASGRLSELS
eukprot:CAMPEP_0203957240 /NCGR_PEP_ID=MMETSP0359-20131031/89179_1 /ASSEMBLY_ACC=CAM_ASM_000338 /TAXON_ID=268821 /ORGANISM="Scrippsiella Hangoei, Strain SHTV-5" /LENGTH=508 /DNA_ID=CAMNT_0050891059 /DNA_START=24 /DNA_END=1550 /DNA_ORIENTATION=+